MGHLGHDHPGETATARARPKHYGCFRAPSCHSAYNDAVYCLQMLFDNAVH